MIYKPKTPHRSFGKCRDDLEHTLFVHRRKLVWACRRCDKNWPMRDIELTAFVDGCRNANPL